MTPEQLRALVGSSFQAGAARPAGRVWFRVEGVSMRPLLRPGDEVLLAPLAGPPRLLELAAFEREGKIALHRTIFVRGGRALLKGDGLPLPDLPVPFERLLARAAARRRGGRELRAGSLRWRLASAWSVAFSLLRWARHVVSRRRRGSGGTSRGSPVG